MSQTIALLNKLKSSGEMSSDDLSNVILKDYALTLKILRLINSVGFVQFGEVTTISGPSCFWVSKIYAILHLHCCFMSKSEAVRVKR